MLAKNRRHDAILAICLILLCKFSGMSLQAQTRESFAIMELEGRGISAVEAQALTDRLSSLIVRTGKVTVVERGQIAAVLQEQDFQLAGCTSDECAVEIGQLLGVTKIVAGSIGKLGSTYSMDVRVIDVETGKISNSIIRDYRGEIDGLLAEIAHVAREIVDFEVGSPEARELLQQPLTTPAIGQPTSRPPPVLTVENAGGPQKKGGRGLLWVALGLAAAGGGAYALTLGGDTPAAGGEEVTIGLPPGVPTQ